MLKTRTEILEKMYADTAEMTLYKEAEIDLCNGKIISTIADDKKRAFYEDTMKRLKSEKAGQEIMLNKIKAMLESEEKNHVAIPTNRPSPILRP